MGADAACSEPSRRGPVLGSGKTPANRAELDRLFVRKNARPGVPAQRTNELSQAVTPRSVPLRALSIGKLNRFNDDIYLACFHVVIRNLLHRA
jgi:hypothetical protein